LDAEPNLTLTSSPPDGALSKTLTSLSASSSQNSSLSSISTADTHRERADSATASLRASLVQTVLSPQPAPSVSLPPDAESKWTCMVCLSKHPSKEDICLICGSERPVVRPSYQLNTSQLATSLLDRTKLPSRSPSSELFSSYLIGELGLKHKLSDQPESRATSSTSACGLPPKENPYLRKWTCVQCNFSNDSLKIVCLNCRWIKTSPRSLAPSEPGSDSKEPKRAKLDEVLSVDVSPAPVCASCKSPIVAETAATPTSTSEAVAKTPAKRLDFSTATLTPEKAPSPSPAQAPATSKRL